MKKSYWKLEKAPHFLSQNTNLMELEKINFINEVMNFNNFLLHHSRRSKTRITFCIVSTDSSNVDIMYTIGFDIDLMKNYVNSLRYLKLRNISEDNMNYTNNYLPRIIGRKINFKICGNLSDNNNMTKINRNKNTGIKMPRMRALDISQNSLYFIPLVQKCDVSMNTQSQHLFNTIECIGDSSGYDRLSITVNPMEHELANSYFSFAQNCITLYSSTYGDVDNCTIYRDLYSQEEINLVDIEIYSKSNADRIMQSFLSDMGYDKYMNADEIASLIPSCSDNETKEFIENKLHSLYSSYEINNLLIPPFSFKDAVPRINNYTVRPSSIPNVDNDNVLLLDGDANDKIEEGFIKIGELDNGKTIYIHQNILMKHMFITGTTGSGKSTYIKHLINAISPKIHFMVIDPIKEEYIDYFNTLYSKGIREKPLVLDMKIGTSTDENVITKINPFVLPKGVNLNSHVSFIASVFSAIMPSSTVGLDYIIGILKNTYIEKKKNRILNSCRKDNYAHVKRQMIKNKNNISINDKSIFEKEAKLIVDEEISKTYDKFLFDAKYTYEYYEKNLNRYPTIEDLQKYGFIWLKKITLQNKTKEFTSDNDKEIYRYFEKWLSKFKDIYPLVYKFFSQDDTTKYYDFINEIDKSDIVITMKSVENTREKKALFLYFVGCLNNYRRGMNSEMSVGNDGSNLLKHVTILEEAHRIIPRKVEQSGQDMALSASEQTNELISNMLAEIRGFGEGIIISEQSPSKIINDTIINTSIKIMKQVTYGEDINKLGDALGLNDFQKKYLAYLKKEDMLVFISGINQSVYLSLNIDLQ